MKKKNSKQIKTDELKPTSETEEPKPVKEDSKPKTENQVEQKVQHSAPIPVVTQDNPKTVTVKPEELKKENEITSSQPLSPPDKSIEEKIKEIESVLKGLNITVKKLKRKNNIYKKREKEFFKTIEEMKQIFGTMHATLPKKVESRPLKKGGTLSRKKETPKNDNSTPQNV